MWFPKLLFHYVFSKLFQLTNCNLNHLIVIYIHNKPFNDVCFYNTETHYGDCVYNLQIKMSFSLSNPRNNHFFGLFLNRPVSNVMTIFSSTCTDYSYHLKKKKKDYCNPIICNLLFFKPVYYNLSSARILLGDVSFSLKHFS